MRQRPEIAQQPSARPWYREPWPWLIISGPAIVVVAGCYTLWLAIASNDGLVADDYYKQGLAINKVLVRERAAAESHYEARVMLAPSAGRVRVVLTGSHLPGRLALRLTHPTRAGLDRSVSLEPAGGGVYEGALALPVAGRWRVSLEDEHSTWRLAGEAQLPADEPLVLGAAPR